MDKDDLNYELIFSMISIVEFFEGKRVLDEGISTGNKIMMMIGMDRLRAGFIGLSMMGIFD